MSGESERRAAIEKRVLEALGESGRQTLGSELRAVVSRLADLVAAERTRCAEACRERAALWEGTAARRSTVAAAREEARARHNEALYLADLLESGLDGPNVESDPLVM